MFSCGAEKTPRLGSVLLDRKGLIMRHAVIIDAVRTPIGRAHPDKGIFRDVRADDLSADLMSALLKRVEIPPALVEDIHWGCVKQQAEQGYNIGRMSALI